MDGGEKNIYQTLSFEIWMEERKTYTKHCHLRYGWRKEKHIPNNVIGDMDGGEKQYTKHYHLKYGRRKEKQKPNNVN
jgi:hypothetical protein